MQALFRAHVLEDFVIGEDAAVGADDDEMGEMGASEHYGPEEGGCRAFVGKNEHEKWGEGIGACLAGGGAGPAIGGEAVQDNLFGH